MAMCGHESPVQQTDTWLTPPEILEKLGRFDLDPCCPNGMPWITANKMITPDEDGLKADWAGRVWLNPPWGKMATPWIERLSKHGNGIALLPARTETKAFFDFVWKKADAVLFVKGRPSFHYLNGNKAKASCGVPIVLVAYGFENTMTLEGCGLGVCVRWGVRWASR